MYAEYFGLRREPFSIAPDPQFLFMSERHREALAHLLFGVGGGGGFVLLTGEIGTGKTTVCRSFLEQVPAHCNLAYIFNPKLTVIELLQSVCEEFHIAVPPSGAQPPTVKDYLDPLNAYLLREHAAGRNNVLIIDEAQNLSADVLEQLRLLTNLETAERKLLQIILIGQPELRDMLARPELEQLAQRVIARYHLDAMSREETEQYIRHRMDVAGLQRPLPLDARALRRIHQLTGGVPRRVNLLVDRALLGAFATGQPAVTRKVVEQAAREVFDQRPVRVQPWRRTALAAAMGLLAGAGLLAAALALRDDGTVAARAPSPPVVAAPAVRSMPAVQAPAPVPGPALAQTPPLPAAPAAAPALLHEPDQAWRELALAWKLTPGAGDACVQLAREQVQCFTRRLDLALIRQLGRPGIVTLDAGSSRPAYAVLTALTDSSATLRAGGTEQTVTLAALAARWQGDFATLWRAPAAYSGAVADGKGGPVVDWVAQRLAALDGQPVPADGRAVLDAALRARVRAFQIAQGVPADGRPGPMTLMQLNRAAGVDEPRLRSTSP